MFLAVLENKESKSIAFENVLSDIIEKLKSSEGSMNASKFYQNSINRTTKLWSNILESTLVVGQLQLLRTMIAFQLSMSCKFDAKNLASSLNTLNMYVFT